MSRKHTQGWYLFKDGYYCWLNGMSGDEKRIMVRQHGNIVEYTPTYC